MPAPPYSDQATVEQIQAETDRYVDSFIGGLQSFFELMPKGVGFVQFERFRIAYGILREETDGFGRLELERVLSAIRRDPLALVVLRSILGITPPELASLVRGRTG